MYSGALGARLSTDAAAVRSMVGDNLALAVQNLSTIVCGLSIAFSANWELALVVLALVPLLSMQSFLQVKFMKGFSNDAKVQSSKLLLPLTSLSPFPYNYHQTKIADVKAFPKISISYSFENCGIVLYKIINYKSAWHCLKGNHQLFIHILGGTVQTKTIN